MQIIYYENYFGQYGMKLNIQIPELTIQGNVDYSTLSPFFKEKPFSAKALLRSR